MNMNTAFPSSPIAMPMDHSTIITSFSIPEELITNPDSYCKKTGLELRVSEPKYINKGDKQYTGRKLYIGSCGGLAIEVIPAGGKWQATQVHLNPGKILYGHNGRALNETECLIALSQVIELVNPALDNPDDWIHILPGITKRSAAYWSKLEIPLNLYDPDGSCEDFFRNPKHPEIKKKALRADEESVKLGRPRAMFKISFYRKDLEMEDLLNKNNASAPQRIFRIEAILKGSKLIDALKGDGQTRQINGTVKLVRFTAADLVSAHREKMLKLEGCYHAQGDISELPNDNTLGRFMGQICHRHSLVLDDLMDIYRKRIGFSRNTEGRHRSAARDELSRLSLLSFEDIFAQKAYQNQPSIIVPRLENLLRSRREIASIHPLVAGAYGSLPTDAYRNILLS